MQQVICIQAGIALRADLLFICKAQHGGVLRGLRPQFCAQRRIGANAVIVPVRTDHAAVKPKVTRGERRHCRQFRTQEIALGHTVFFVQQLHGVQLYAVFGIFIRVRQRADQNIQLFGAHAVRQGTAVLLFRKMRQQIADGKHGVVCVFANAHGHHFTVGAHKNAV
ncbi:hypothetical protein SDC9_146322 [bioreactor metagenome]|uniref:Uncharacterized protein n=1 Tax=bioreactor metagenome TaxID=1076179 RepID=A0A645ECQ9_9ZZZZ